MTPNEPTWHALVREETDPNLSDTEVHDLLWNCSSFPFGDEESVRSTLREYWEKGGKTVQGAMDASHAALDYAMSQFHAEKRDE
jgi:hypothetical protein